MKLGPVGSIAKDIAEQSDILQDEDAEYPNRFVVRQGEHDYKAIKPVEMDFFSKSDIEALDFAIKNLGHLDKYVLAELSHAYPEWNKHEARIQSLRPRVEIKVNKRGQSLNMLNKR